MRAEFREGATAALVVDDDDAQSLPTGGAGAEQARRGCGAAARERRQMRRAGGGAVRERWWSGVQAAAQWMHGRGAAVARRLVRGRRFAWKKKERETDAWGPRMG